MPSYHAVPADERAQQTYKAITTAAITAFGRYGYAATTMSAVAAMAGVSPRTVYRHFESKSALFAATIAVGAADFLEQFAGYIQRWPLRQAILTAFTNTAVEASEESRNLMHLVVSEDEVYGHWLLTSQRMAPALADMLRIAASAHPDHEDPMVWEVRASALLAAFSSAYRRWASTSGSDLLEFVTHAVDTVLPILGDIRWTTDPVAANENS